MGYRQEKIFWEINYLIGKTCLYFNVIMFLIFLILGPALTVWIMMNYPESRLFAVSGILFYAFACFFFAKSMNYKRNRIYVYAKK